MTTTTREVSVTFNDPVIPRRLVLDFSKRDAKALLDSLHRAGRIGGFDSDESRTALYKTIHSLESFVEYVEKMEREDES